MRSAVAVASPVLRCLLAGLLLACCCGAAMAEDAAPDDEQLRKAKLYADVVMRLKGTELDAKTMQSRKVLGLFFIAAYMKTKGSGERPALS